MACSALRLPGSEWKPSAQQQRHKPVEFRYCNVAQDRNAAKENLDWMSCGLETVSAITVC
jgi:hypothetical protein